MVLSITAFTYMVALAAATSVAITVVHMPDDETRRGQAHFVLGQVRMH